MYHLKLSFEWGGGYLWCDNDKARKQFDLGPIEDKLPLAPHVRERLENLSEWHDTGLDWNNPAGPSPWTDAEYTRFHQAARELLIEIQRELGPDFTVKYDPFDEQPPKNLCNL